jgi:hypothetical protein
MAMPATAADGVGVPSWVRSTWSQPGTGALDGLGAYLYIAPEPAADPSQLPAAYDYVLEFSYEAAQVPGGIGLGSQGPGGAKFAALATGGSGTVILPYEWSPGRLYFLFAHGLGDGAWGGWVLDVWAEQWTFIGQGSTPVEWGRLSPTSWTEVSWEGDSESLNPCSAYPRTDAYFTPAFGVRDGSFTLGTAAGEFVQPDGCPAEISTVLGWAHYRLGE